jgi:hypothetical protein
MKSKNTDCIAKSENVINETYMHVEAGDLLAKARRYYTATDFITASEYASKARDLYKTLGDGEKALESEEILNKSLSMLEGGYGGRGLFGNVPKLVVIALFAEVVLLVLVVVTRPKTRTWFRGLVGLGRSASGFRVGVSRLGGNVTRPVKRDVKPKAVEEKLFK